MIKAVSIPLASGKIGWVHAGPTREMPDGYKLIRCAAEIPTPVAKVAYDVSTKDFTPFDGGTLADSLPDILRDLEDGKPLFIGCMGGTGRTGTLLAILVGQHPAFTGEMAIAYVRTHYKSGAVETSPQEDQVVALSEKKHTIAAPFIFVDDEPYGGVNSSSPRPWWKPLWLFG